MNKKNIDLRTDGVDIVLQDVVFKINNRKIFDGLSCSLDKNLITVLLGYNGAGKTAFLKLLSGLSKPDKGIVKLSTSSEKILFENVTMLFHKPVMLKRSVWSNIVYGLRLGAMDKNELFRFIQDAKIQHLVDRSAREISAGEQQRVAFVRALATQPRVLLLDEPTSNLDPFSIDVIEELIKKISRLGVKIVMVTHNVEQAKRLAGEMIFMQDGKILEQKTREQLFQKTALSILQRFALGQELKNDQVI